jgi:hypothetical protein
MAYIITNKTDKEMTLSLRGTTATLKAGETLLSTIVVPTNPLFKLAKTGEIELVRITNAELSALNNKMGNECSGEGCDKAECCVKSVAEAVAEAVTEAVTEVVTEEVVTEVVTEEVVTEEVVTEEVVAEEVVTEEVVTEEVVAETEAPKRKGKK